MAHALYICNTKQPVRFRLRRHGKTAVHAPDKGGKPQSGTAAEFTLAGGTGYVPVTISGVSGYSGWRLEFERDGAWHELEQGVHGNDYWQTWYDASDGTSELTFNVPSSKAPQKYRLIKKQ